MKTNQLILTGFAVCLFAGATALNYAKYRHQELERIDVAQMDCMHRALSSAPDGSSPQGASVQEDLIYPFSHEATTDFLVKINFDGKFSRALCTYKKDGSLIAFQWAP